MLIVSRAPRRTCFEEQSRSLVFFSRSATLVFGGERRDRFGAEANIARQRAQVATMRLDHLTRGSSWATVPMFCRHERYSAGFAEALAHNLPEIRLNTGYEERYVRVISRHIRSQIVNNAQK